MKLYQKYLVGICRVGTGSVPTMGTRHYRVGIYDVPTPYVLIPAA